MAYVKGIGIEFVIWADDDCEPVTYHFDASGWQTRERPPYRHAEVDTALLVDAQVYSLTDGVQ